MAWSASARYAGKDGNYEANNRLLLKELKVVPPDRGNTRFVSFVAVSVPGYQIYFVEGSCTERIAEEPQGEGGFGYDPLFIYESTGKLSPV